MINYMVPIDLVLPKKTVEVHVVGQDLESLLYKFLDEFLFEASSGEFFMCREVKIVDFDKEKFEIRALGYGEDFDKERHGGKGTEVKAVTYSAMNIVEGAEKCETFVVVDI